MKKKFLFIVVFLTFGAMVHLVADDETELIKSYLRRPFPTKVVTTGKVSAQSSGTHNSYMKNPVFSMGLEKAFSNSAYSFKFAGIGLELDVSGKYSLGKKMAGFEKKVAEEGLKGAVFDHVAHLRGLLARLYYLDRKRLILEKFTKKTEELAKELALLVEGKSHSEFDLLRVSTLLLSHRRKLVFINSELSGLKATVKEIVGKEIVKLSLEIPELLDLAQIRNRALNENSQIKETKLNIAGASTSMDLAKRSIAPDLGLEVGFKKEDMPGLKPEYSAEIGVSFELPVFNFNNKEVAKARGEKYRKVLELSEKKRALSIQLTELFEKVTYLRENMKIDMNKDEILEKGLFLYRKGEVSISDLIATIYEIEELHFSDVEIKESIHYYTLDLYATAGFFESDKINELIDGAIK